MRPTSKKEPSIDNRLDDRAHAVDLAPVVRDHAEQHLLAPVGRIVRSPRVGNAIDRRRQIGQKATRALKRLLLGVHGVVDRAGATLDLPAAELLLVRAAGPRARPPAARPRTSPRSSSSSPNSGWRRAARRRAPPPSPSPSATTGTVAKVSASNWKPMLDCPSPPGRLARPVVSMVLTEPPPPEPSMMRTIGRRSSPAMRSARMGLVGMVASAEPPRTVKSSPTTTTGRPSIRARPITQFDGVSRVKRAVGIILGLAGNGADLMEAAAVDQGLDALAHREPPALVLALHLVGAAHLARHALARPQLVELCLPVHVCVPELVFPPLGRSCRPHSLRQH